MKRIAIVSMFLAGSVVLSGCTAPQAHFGQPLRLNNADMIQADELLTAPTGFDGKFVRVRGEVTEVCAAMGCWLKLKGGKGEQTLFVKFTCPVEGARLVPLEAVGHTAVIEGTVTVEEISEDEARHYANDAGKSTDQIAKIVGPQKQVRIASPGVLIEGLEPPAAEPERAPHAGDAESDT